VDIDSCTPIIAGEYGTWRITYTAGKYGIENGGRIKIVWRLPSDWGIPQWTNPSAPNYITVMSTSNASFDLEHYARKGHYRPWLRSLVVSLRDGYLKEGDKITITLGDRSGGSPGSLAQTFYQRDFYFRVLVECFETNVFKEVPDQPVIPVVAGPATRLKVIGPSQVAPGEDFCLIVKAEDKWGNVADTYKGAVDLTSSGAVNGLPRQCIFDDTSLGFVHVNGVSFLQEGVFSIRAHDQISCFEAISNPIECIPKSSPRLTWGDLHAQTGSTVGMGTESEYFDYARDVAGVQVSSIEGNDFDLSCQGWEDLKRAASEKYVPGEFVAFLGYEWSGNTPGGGDHCVYYIDEDIPIHRTTHWKLQDKSDEHNDRYPVRELYNELKDKRAFLIPHIGGRRASLEYLTPDDQDLVPVIEIASVHGRFEWFLHEAFDKGLIVGVVGDSDDHTCRPGAAYPTKVSTNCRGSLTGIYARELTREGIWEALKARRCYATTGDRIILKFSANGRLMGSTIDTSLPPTLDIEVIGTGPIEKVEILRGKEVACSRAFPDNARFALDAFKITWGGARSTLRPRYSDWNGHLSIEDGRFTSVKQIAFKNPKQGIKNWDSDRIEWESSTCGDWHGLVVGVDHSLNTLVKFVSEPASFTFPVSNIFGQDIYVDAGKVGQFVNISRVPSEKGPSHTKFSFVDKNIKKGLNPYYVRVTQEDGEMAWSSPIYVKFS
jgi:hypothetical protein